MLSCAAGRHAKPVDDFALDRTRKRGRQYSCRACQAKAAAARYKARPEHHRRLVREHRQRHLAQALVRGAKKRADKRGLPFDLGDHMQDIARRLDAGICELSGLPFDFNGTRGAGWANPSIDRINNLEGYVHSNVRLILHGLNTAIGAWGEEVLSVWCLRGRQRNDAGLLQRTRFVLRCLATQSHLGRRHRPRRRG